MRKILFFILAANFFNYLTIAEAANSGNYNAATEVKASDVKTVPQLSTEALIPSYLPYLKVNVVTGEYVECEEDLIVAGSEPLSLRRIYHHLARPDFRYGSWSFNPQSALVANFGWEEKPLFASVGDKNGSLIPLDQCKEEALPSYLAKTYAREKALCFSISPNCSQGFTSFSEKKGGQLNPANLSVAVWRSSTGTKFAWSGFAVDGFGKISEFATPTFEWHKKKTIILDPPTWRGDFSPDFWTPYFVPVVKEILPNGNVIRYTYTKWREDKHYPSPNLLSSISIFNKNETLLMAKLDFHYEKYKWNHEEVLTHSRQGTPIKYKETIEDISSFKILGSDKRTVSFLNTYRNAASIPICLHEVTTPKGNIKYKYANTFLTEINKENGKIFRTEYDPKTNKVIAQYAPIGPVGELQPILRFQYHDKATVVYDAENNPTIYRYDEKNRIVAIEKYAGDALYSVERKSWDEMGLLLSESIEDASQKIFKKTAFKYDSKGNVLEKTLSGIHGENDTTTYTYGTQDRHLNLLTSEKHDKKEIRYTYKPQTNLVSTEFIYEGGTLRKRTFYTYDDCATCIKKVVDDGKGSEEKDLKGVNTRLITYIKPRRELPCFGLPEVVEEKTINKQGNEILLKKVIYAYHPSGKVEREDHYDANGAFRYSIVNSYDEKERLKKTINALGYPTTFDYDIRGNLKASHSALGEKQWEYDKADRPILEKIGGISTRKIYDRLGRVVEEQNECGYATKYVYDAFGRVIKILYPDGGVVHKEYDILGNVIKETDANGYETKKEYNYKGELLHVTYPDGRLESFTYTPSGGVKEHVDKAGIKTVYARDIFNNALKTETFVNGKWLKTTSATFSFFNKLSETDTTGHTTIFSHDFAGRKILEKKGEREFKYAYDSLGRLTRTQKGDVIYVEEFDLLGNLIEKRTEDVSGMVYFKENYAYDEEGNRIEIQTCQGVTEIAYDGRKMPVRMMTPDGSLKSISYSYANSFTKTTVDPNGRQTVETYGPRMWLESIKIKNIEGDTIQHQEFLYDHEGNCVQTVDNCLVGKKLSHAYVTRREFGPGNRLEKVVEGGHKETSYFYDGKGRLRAVIKPDGTELCYIYDDLGRLSKLSSNKKDVHYIYTYDIDDRVLSINNLLFRQYDKFGNLTKEKLDSGHVIKTSYDAFGNRKTLTFPDGTKVDYSYKGDQLYEVTVGDLTYTFSERNLSSKPTEIILPADLGMISYEYDKCLRLQKISSPFFKSSNLYDPLGRLILQSITDSLRQRETSYVYNDLFQLISENGMRYVYDSLNNRLSQNGKEFTFNELCQLTHDGEKEYTYDANGNLIQAGNAHFFYDSLDRLIKVQEDNESTEYVYDGLNRRILKRTPTKTIHYIWDGDKEIGSSDNELRVFGNGVMCFSILDKETLVPFQDTSGSVVTEVNLSGKVVGNSRYNAYGEVDTASGPWGYLANRLDPETGFVYMGKGAYYMPSLGRWLAPTSVSSNPYAFKNCNPFVECGEWLR